MDVLIPHLQKDAIDLGVDGDCTFSIGSSGLDEVAMLTLADGGGFTGFLMTHAEWPEIRAKIDAFISAAPVSQ